MPLRFPDFYMKVHGNSGPVSYQRQMEVELSDWESLHASESLIINESCVSSTIVQ